jgi:hypothetical protein
VVYEKELTFCTFLAGLSGRNGIDKKERKFFRLCLYRMEEAQMKKTMLLCWRWKERN